MLDGTRTVREFAVEVPQAARLFEKLGIDYCCGGSQSLNAACAKARVPVEEVLKGLTETISGDQSRVNWQTADLAELVDHIITTHHGYVKQELPRLGSLMTKVANKHAENHPELRKMQALFNVLNAELTGHLLKEEQILFPYVVECENAVRKQAKLRPPMFGSVKNPIHMMELEHDSAGDALKEMREVSNGFTAPEDGCMSFKALYQGLREFEADLHQHIHLENNILFPRAIALEAQGR